MLMIARRAITGCVKPYEDGFLIRLTFLALSGLRVRRDSGLSMRGRLARGGRTRGRRKGDQRMAVAQDGDSGGFVRFAESSRCHPVRVGFDRARGPGWGRGRELLRGIAAV
jgi:hypothetical protein